MFDLIENSLFGKHFSDLVDFVSKNDFNFCPDTETFRLDENGNYVLTIPFEKGFKDSNVKVNLDNNTTLCVDYCKVTDNSTEAYSLTETLPKNADPDTLRADYDYKNKKLVISAKPKTEKKVQANREIKITKR